MKNIFEKSREDKIKRWIDSGKELNAKYLFITKDTYDGCGADFTEYSMYIYDDNKKDSIINKYNRHPSMIIIKIITL